MNSNNTQILLKHKDFIYAVARLGLSPQHDNTILKEVIEAYDEIDPTVGSVALSMCATCSKPYENAFKTILAYCENENWFNPEMKQ